MVKTSPSTTKTWEIPLGTFEGSYSARERTDSMSPTINSGETPTKTQAKQEWEVDRRSLRSKALIPVFVYGYGASKNPFYEEAYAAVVSDNGGLLIMNAHVEIGQSLLVTNRATEEDRNCRVAYVGEREPDEGVVGIEFAEPAPSFWRLTKRTEPANSNAEKQNGTS